MACSNVATLVRFVVKAEIACGSGGAEPDPFTGTLLMKSITKVAGLDMGKEGEISVPFWGRLAKISDGVRVFSMLTMGMRVPLDALEAASANPDFESVLTMYDVRGQFKYNIRVIITDRAFRPLYVFRFLDCDMKELAMDDQDMASPGVGMWNMAFLPGDVRLTDCTGARVIIRAEQDRPVASLVAC